MISPATGISNRWAGSFPAQAYQIYEEYCP